MNETSDRPHSGQLHKVPPLFSDGAPSPDDFVNGIKEVGVEKVPGSKPADAGSVSERFAKLEGDVAALLIRTSGQEKIIETQQKWIDYLAGEIDRLVNQPEIIGDLRPGELRDRPSEIGFGATLRTREVPGD